jgi:hypothetical protein
MPNHIHLPVYLQERSKALNKINRSGQAIFSLQNFLRIRQRRESGPLPILTDGVQLQESKNGKKHQLVSLSFDEKQAQGNRLFITYLLS